MTRGRKPTGKTSEVIRLESELVQAIRRLSCETGKSQSEVVDMWREVYATALVYVNSHDKFEAGVLYEKLEELLK